MCRFPCSIDKFRLIIEMMYNIIWRSNDVVGRSDMMMSADKVNVQISVNINLSKSDLLVLNAFICRAHRYVPFLT